jgi:Na+/H+-dicarboxylate symporter
MEYLKNRSLQTILVLALYSIFAQILPLVAHQTFYTISVFIKDILIWLMPITVCVLIASTIDKFENKAPLFILVLMTFEAISNFLSVTYAFAVGSLITSSIPTFEIIDISDNFNPLWRIPFSKPWWWSADKGSFAGLIIGCLSAFSYSPPLKRNLAKARTTIEFMLTKVFARLIPLFVLGFIAQIYQTGMLSHMIMNYSILILYLIIFLSFYIMMIFAIGAGFNIGEMTRHIKNLTPAWLMAITSSCSLSTMPWTIEGTAKNLRRPALAQAIIPATTNIQQIGDCITNALLCFLIYKQFFGYTPDALTWIAFSLVFVAARFATAAVMGGAIFLMLPIYQTYLDFNDEMIAIILALNVILDPIVTSTNVITNGGMAKIFEDLWRKISLTN